MLVGNWDGELVAPADGEPGKGDTIMVRRGNRFFVKNDLVTGVAEYFRDYGNARDTVLVADWVGGGLRAHRMFIAAPRDSDGADQLVVRRGNEYIASEELRINSWELYLQSAWVVDYGDPDDSVFVASFPTELSEDVYDASEVPDHLIEADGLGVRRTR